MLSKVFDTDDESMIISFAGTHGAIVLFDFEAVFPSISQTLLLDTFSKRGLARGSPPDRSCPLLEVLMRGQNGRLLLSGF